MNSLTVAERSKVSRLLWIDESLTKDLTFVSAEQSVCVCKITRAVILLKI